MPREMRFLDKHNGFICLIEPERAERLVASGRAEYFGKPRRRAVRLLTEERAEALLEEMGRRPSQLSVYREMVAGHPTISLKRLDASGQLLPWHDDLTFAQLRRGLTRPPGIDRRKAMLDSFEQKAA